MEQVIFISKIENLKYVLPKYSRFYFGNEFCQRLIPSLADLNQALDFALAQEVGFSLVTPYLTNPGLEQLRPLLSSLYQKLPQTEVIINDWGLHRLLKQEFPQFNQVLGRLLTKQKRGPRILKLKQRTPGPMWQHFQQSNIDLPVLTDFLIKNRIMRVELDNLLQGLYRDSPGIKASLYFPFAYVSTSRFCSAATCEKNIGFSRDIAECNTECRRYTFTLRHKHMPAELLLKGNSQFFANHQLASNLEQLNIDRIVYEPEIPL